MINLTTMRCAAAAAMLVGALSMQACDRKVAETTRTEQGPNGTKVEKQTVIEHSDGTVSQEKETRKVENP